MEGFASGLFETLGLAVRDGQIFVHGKDQITRLIDFNNDGEADLYDNFVNPVNTTPSFHDFALISKWMAKATSGSAS